MKSGQTLGFPLFKSLNRFPGFSLKSHGDGWRFTPEDNWKHGSLRLSGVGQIAARGQARQGGEIRASEVLHRNGQWFLSLTLDIGTPNRERTADGAMAFDWGVETFLSGVTHAGEVIAIDNPRWWQADKDKIVALQREVSSKPNNAPTGAEKPLQSSRKPRPRRHAVA
mgnify:FL=1